MSKTKLRKMLGDINAPSVTSLMRQIETQSQKTLLRFASDYVEAKMLPIYERELPGDERPGRAVEAVKAYLAGEKALKDVKPILREANQAAKEASANPAAQAAARAVYTACAVIQTPTSALGFTFYAAAALAYSQAGLEEKQDVYDALAEEEFGRILEMLKEVSVENEPEPAKIRWGC